MRRKLADYISHPKLLLESSIEDLELWVNEFPYSANLRILMAQKIKAEGKETEYPDAMTNAMLYAQNRQAALQQIEKSDPIHEVYLSEEYDAKPTLARQHIEETEDFVASQSKELVTDKVMDADAKNDDTAQAVEEDGEIMNDEHHSEKLHIDKGTNVITAAATIASLVGDENEDQQIDVNWDDVIYDEVLISDEEKQEPVSDNIEINNIEESPSEKESATDVVTSEGMDENSSIIDQQLESPEPSTMVSTEEAPALSNADSDDEGGVNLTPFSQWLIHLEGDRIDPDLQQTDKIENDDEEVISETLASLYARQGHKEEAVLMYEKLGLKYPEKNRYFADQIEKLLDS